MTFVDPEFYQDFSIEYVNWIPEEHVSLLVALRLFLGKVTIALLSEFIETKSKREVELYVDFFRKKIDEHSSIPGAELMQVLE